MKTETNEKENKSINGPRTMYNGLKSYAKLASAIVAISIAGYGVKSCMYVNDAQMHEQWKENQANGAYLHKLADVDCDGKISPLEFSLLNERLLSSPGYYTIGKKPADSINSLAKEIRDSQYSKLTLADAPYIDFAIAKYNLDHAAALSNHTNE